METGAGGCKTGVGGLNVGTCGLNVLCHRVKTTKRKEKISRMHVQILVYMCLRFNIRAGRERRT